MADPSYSPQDKPTVITPDSGVADGCRISEYYQYFRHDRITPDGTVTAIGHWHDRVEFARKYGRPSLRRRQTVSSIDEIDWQQEVEVDRETLAPYSVVMHSGDYLHSRVLYDKSIVHVTRHMWPEGIENEEPVVVDLVLKPEIPLFEWQLWELTIAAMPLAHGFSCQFLAHYLDEEPTSPLIRVAVSVSGTEIVETPDGPVDCWKVEVIADNPWTVWVCRDIKCVPIVQMEIRFPDYTDRWTREEFG